LTEGCKSSYLRVEFVTDDKFLTDEALAKSGVFQILRPGLERVESLDLDLSHTVPVGSKFEYWARLNASARVLKMVTTNPSSTLLMRIEKFLPDD
jgi:hypothetical protein